MKKKHQCRVLIIKTLCEIALGAKEVNESVKRRPNTLEYVQNKYMIKKMRYGSVKRNYICHICAR